ncbi:DUF1847 domain-containing protein [Sinanaerobacter chloroacetimidivorans]|nr:DUF1847 domain-containing protein [Sinanaerobacter chloroacetimidivorans]
MPDVSRLENGKASNMNKYYCALCTDHYCRSGEVEKTTLNCPCNDDDIESIKELYQEEENFNLAYHSALTEAEGYGNKTRLEEIMDFAKKCGFSRLGIAFCLGLSKEANTLCKILRHNSFEVVSVICKNGSIPKEFLNISQEQKLRPNTYEPMCNPIGQAKLLNKAETELNIILGLCVGHDSLFIKYSEAPVTVFAVKDRVLAHNPLGALYLCDSYYKNRLFGNTNGSNGDKK